MLPSSSGLGHNPFKVTARVQIPLGVPTQCRVAQLAEQLPVKEKVCGIVAHPGSLDRSAAGSESPVQRVAPDGRKEGRPVVLRLGDSDHPSGEPRSSIPRTKPAHADVTQVGRVPAFQAGGTGSRPVVRSTIVGWRSSGSPSTTAARRSGSCAAAGGSTSAG